jgi:hypothetical protein
VTVSESLSIRSKQYLIIHYGGMVASIGMSFGIKSLYVAKDHIDKKGSTFFIDSFLSTHQKRKSDGVKIDGGEEEVAKDVQEHKEEAIRFMDKLFSGDIPCETN